jgi:DNA-binding HxlR family transcriptional regulator
MSRSTIAELRELVKITHESLSLDLRGLEREAMVQAAAKALVGKKAK